VNPVETSKTYQIKVLEKTIRILNLFDQKGKELAARQIYQALDLNKSTTLRILNILENAGYLERDPNTLKYRLGFKLFFLGSLAEGYAELVRLAHPFLEELNEKCDETVQLTVLDHGEVLYLDKLEGKKPVRVVSRVGQKLPAHCTALGKVLLSFLSNEALDEIIRERGLTRFTKNTITSRTALKIELEKVREKGYAIDNEEVDEGLKCLATPLRDSDNEVIAAISIAAPRERLRSKEIESLIPEIKKTSAAISEAFKRRYLKQRVSQVGQG
jgi:DNA-binding IclR family transcriptional regulator